MCGYSYRSSDIRSQRKRTESGRKRRGRSARGAAGRAAEIVGIVGGPINLVVALELAKPDRDVGLADDDGTGLLQPRDDKRIFGRHKILELRKAPGSRESCDIEWLLQRHRDAEQGSMIAARQRGIRRLRRRSRAIEVADDHRIDALVQ